MQTEVPLPIPGDRRAWDARIGGAGWMLHVEAETALRDVQALERRVALKASDAGVGDVLLLIADTRRNRAALAGTREALRIRFPLDTRQVLWSLGRGGRPSGGGIVLL